MNGEEWVILSNYIDGLRNGESFIGVFNSREMWLLIINGDWWWFMVTSGD
jgi:hypothetical protein